MFTKSGIMVGLGEERNEVLQLMDDLRLGRCRFPDHRPVSAADQEAPSRCNRFVTPDEFTSYATVATTKGFLLVSSSPLTRSSHHAGEDFAGCCADRGWPSSPMPDACSSSGMCRTCPSRMFDLVNDLEGLSALHPQLQRRWRSSRRGARRRCAVRPR